MSDTGPSDPHPGPEGPDRIGHDSLPPEHVDPLSALPPLADSDVFHPPAPVGDDSSLTTPQGDETAQTLESATPPPVDGSPSPLAPVGTEMVADVGVDERPDPVTGPLHAAPSAAFMDPDWLGPEPSDVASSATPTTASEGDPPQPPERPQPWRGSCEAYEIGDPGRAASRCVPRQDAKFPWVPDTIADGVTIDHEDEPVLIVRAASVCGSSHRHSATVRQDSYGFAVSPDKRYLVAIVADGVSSGRRSHFAAQVVTAEGPYRLASHLMTYSPDTFPWKAFLQRDLLPHLQAETQRFTPDREVDVSDIAQVMATTLVIGVIGLAPDEHANHPVWVTRLGDSSGWIIGAEGVWRPLGEVKNESAVIAESSTTGLPFIPDDELPVTQTTLGPGEVFVLMTDGIGDPLGGGRGEVGHALAALWKTPPSPIHFAAQIDFARRTFDDDRTAVAVWPTGGE